MTWGGSRFIMFGAVRLRAVRAAWYELFVHSERIRAVTQGARMLNLCCIYVVDISWNISLCVLAVRKTARYMCICSNNHFSADPVYAIIWNVAEPSQMKCCWEMLRSRPKWNVAKPSQMKCCREMLRSRPKWNVAEPSQMKCCGAVPNEVSKKIVNSLWRIDYLSINYYEFVSNGEGVNYSILLGQCAPLLGVCGGLDGTG